MGSREYIDYEDQYIFTSIRLKPPGAYTYTTVNGSVDSDQSSETISNRAMVNH